MKTQWILFNILMLTVALNTTISTPSEPANDLSGLREDVDGDEGVEGDELDQDVNLPEEFGDDEEDEFLKLNLPDSYRIFFEYPEDQDEDESEDDHDGDDDGEDQDEDEFEDDFHLPEAYRIFF